MNHFTKALLAGAASVALMASPALAEGTTGATTGATGATGSMGATTTGPAAEQLTQRGYTDVQEKAGATETEGQATYTARDSSGTEVELVVDTETGDVISETPEQSKDQ